MKRIVMLAAGAAAIALAGSAQAAMIPAGTFAVADTFSPAITFGPVTGSFSATNGNTINYGGTGFFTNIVSAGLLNGALTFSSLAGGTVVNTAPIANFLSFMVGADTYNFSVDSVTTSSLSNTTGVSESGTLFLLGTTTGSGYDPTGSSLTLSFNSTGSSTFSSSASFSIPALVTTSVPEPTTWAMFAVAFGLIGTGLRRRRPSVTFA